MKYTEFRKQAAGLRDYLFESPELTGTVGGLILGAPIGALIAGKGKRWSGAVKGGAAAALIGLGLGLYERGNATTLDRRTKALDEAQNAFYRLLDKYREAGLPLEDVAMPYSLR